MMGKGRLILLVVALTVIVGTSHNAFYTANDDSSLLTHQPTTQLPERRPSSPSTPVTTSAVESVEASSDAPTSAPEMDSSDKVDSAASVLGGDHVNSGTLRDPKSHKQCPSSIDTTVPSEKTVLEDLLGGGTSNKHITDFCKAYGEEPRLDASARPKIFYALMFGYEFDMLEVALSEIYPIVDHIFITESSVTHSLKHKPLYFQKIKSPRYDRFMNKTTHLVFAPTRKRIALFRTGWEVEKRQRLFFMKDLQKRTDVRAEDIIVGNIDLDEIFSRRLLVRYKYCRTKLDFDIYHFRYHFKCLQEAVRSRYYTTVFWWPMDRAALRPILVGNTDLFKRRTHRKNFPIDTKNNFSQTIIQNGTLVWHMTGFGGVDAVLKKYENSPHRFVGNVTRKEISRNINECIFNGEKRFPVDPLDVIPDFLKRNKCRFQSMGWLGPPQEEAKDSNI